jgi:hypothetical protein
MLKWSQIILWPRQFKLHWRIAIVQNLYLAIYLPTEIMDNQVTLKSKHVQYRERRLKNYYLSICAFFVLFFSQHKTVHTISATPKHTTWGQYSNFFVSWSYVDLLGDKRLLFLPILNHILMYGREKAVFYFKFQSINHIRQMQVRFSPEGRKILSAFSR